MAIVKLSKSGKQVQFISDDGTLYGASVHLLKYIVEGKEMSHGKNFVLLTRMPFSVSLDRFAKSPVWDPESNSLRNDDGNVVTNLKANKDGLSKNSKDTREQVKVFTDKKVLL